MTKGFRRKRGGRVEVEFSRDELALLRQLVEELQGLLGGDPGDAGESGGGAEQDPLARMVDMPDEGGEDVTGDDVKPPDDPVLSRLFPDAYPEDTKASAEFRRYTQGSLRGQKRDAAGVVSRGLAESSGRIVLEGDEAATWLRTLNDVRLALGTKLNVTEDAHNQLASMREGDPRYHGFVAYDWLSYLVDTLVRALW